MNFNTNKGFYKCMKSIRRLSKVCLLFVFVSFSFSAFDSYAQDMINKAFLQEDLTILKRNLETLHAGLYVYVSENELDQWFEKTSLALEDSMTSLEFFRAVAPLNSTIKNGHTKVHYPKFGNSHRIFPLQIYKYKDTFHVRGSFSAQYEPMIGQQIVSIDGIPMAKVFETLRPFVTRDGNNLSLPNEELSSYFGLEHSLFYGPKDRYEVVLKGEGKQEKVKVNSITLDGQIVQYYTSLENIEAVNATINEGIGILKFPTFDTKQLKKKDYKRQLNSFFSRLAKEKVKHLIVDIRDNGGGEPVPTQELISYLYNKEFVMYKEVYTIANKIKDKKYFKKQGVGWLNLMSWTRVKKEKEHYYTPRNDEGRDTYTSKKNAFQGQLYILTNGNSFSAAGEFASFMRHGTGAVFIGEEVGGNKFQATAGVSYTVILPHSQQKVSIPLVVYKMNVNAENDGHGVKPDHRVRNTIEDELEGKDRVMDYAIDLAKRSMQASSAAKVARPPKKPKQSLSLRKGGL